MPDTAARMVCAFGDCQNYARSRTYTICVTITTNRSNKTADRKFFCCVRHAREWLQKYEAVYGEQP